MIVTLRQDEAVNAPTHLYAIALGSNRRHFRYGAPGGVLTAALHTLASVDITMERASPIMTSAPVGPSQRRYANMAALVTTERDPEQLLHCFKQIERDFGRRRGRRWGARVLDLDIILWSGGAWATGVLTIPHPLWANRRFVADPLAAIAGNWRDPVSGQTVRQVARRLARPQPARPYRGPLTLTGQSLRGSAAAQSAGP